MHSHVRPFVNSTIVSSNKLYHSGFQALDHTVKVSGLGWHEPDIPARRGVARIDIGHGCDLQSQDSPMAIIATTTAGRLEGVGHGI